jgi:exopolyphosphatase/guanosine-5'-triphosphate,3'-diphosphate pyrophosphatase
MLMAALIEKLKPVKIVIAPGGLRDGLIFDAFPEKIRERNSLYDACRDLARGRTQGINIGQPLIEFLSDIGTHLPMVFEPKNESRLRRAACYLVGLGRGLHPDHRAEIAFETVLFAPLPTMTHKERAYLALMLYGSYTSKISVPDTQTIDYFLDEQEQRAARIYGEAMRFGVVLSGRSGDVLDRQKLTLNGDTLELEVSSDFDGLIVERCRLRLKRLAKMAGFLLPAKGF